MKIQDSNGNFKSVVGLLDTQCHRGIWISARLVERLGLSKRIRRANNPPRMISGTGHDVNCVGEITLEWKWHPNGTRIHDEDPFFVFEDGHEFDVIFGRDFIVKNELLKVRRYAFLPLTEHGKITKCK
jgi:hypothetical protein